MIRTTAIVLTFLGAMPVAAQTLADAPPPVVRPATLYVPPPAPIYISGPITEAPRPIRRSFYIPRARWDHRAGTQRWSLALMGALAGSASGLANTTPRDIDDWCPAYLENPPHLRRAFWAGMMSALAKHESTYRPDAVGGGGRWFGLLQISPPTARHYGCLARDGDALKDPVANLGCAARIMATTVRRDNAIAIRDGRWRGVAADWGPMTDAVKIAEMSAWTRRQSYCVPLSSHRPVARPADLEARIASMEG